MLEGNSGSPWSKLPLKAGSTMKEEVAQGFFQLSPERFQGWRLHCLSGKPDPLLGCCTMNHLPLCPFWTFLISIYDKNLSSFYHVPFRSVIISPCSHSFKGWMMLALCLPSKGKCSSSDHLGEHLLNLLVFNKHLLCAGRCMGFNKLWEEESNHFPG